MSQHSIDPEAVEEWVYKVESSRVIHTSCTCPKLRGSDSTIRRKPRTILLDDVEECEVCFQ